MKSIKLIFLSFVLCSLHFGICEAQWVEMSNGIGSVWISALTTSGNNIFAGTPTGVYLSTNNGLIWTQTSLNNQDVKSIAVSGNIIFAGSFSGNGVYKSTDNGTTWTQTSLNNQVIRTLAISGNNIYAGCWSGNGVYKSTDLGTTWALSLNNQTVRSMAVNGNNVYVGTGNNPLAGVYLSTDNGISWAQTSLNDQFVGALLVNGNNIYAGTSQPALYVSTNNCATWTQTSLNSSYVYSLAKSGNNIFVGTYNTGIYASTDNGASWLQRNEGLTISNTLVGTLCLLNNFIFAGIGTGGAMGVFRRPLSEFTGIKPISNEVPNKFILSQNYPNPFNPSTKIKFALPNSSFAKLVVYDALGRELETLVNEQLNSGTYEVNWIASNYPSGVYFYTLRSNGFSQTNKMLLIK
jgi:hypothetical protein